MDYHKTDLKTKILNTTLKMINEKGAQHVSMRMIARELQVSATAIYRHYENYAHLMNQVIERGEQLFSDYLLTHYDNTLPVLNQLFIMAENYIHFTLDYPFLYDLMFISEYTPITSPETMLCETESPGMTQLINNISALIHSKSLLVSKEALLIQFWAFIQGYAILVRFHHFNIDHQLIESSLSGLLEVWK